MAAAAALAEDEIIKKRLLIDGEGDGDDRRLNRLLKTFLRFCSPTCPEEERLVFHSSFLYNHVVY